MSQVVSRNLTSGDGRKDGQLRMMNRWKEPLMIAFHGAAASTYGFAICWQNVSQASAQLYARTNPLMRQYGRWRFLTYNCLIMQFVACSLCFTSHFVPKLRRTRDFFFTTFAFPIGILVVSSFWGIWFTFGRESISPKAIEPFYPPWLNHVTHTIIAPINILELILAKKQYSSDKRSITALAGYTLSYTSFLLYIRFQTGRFVYPFLNNMDTIPVGAFIAGMVVFVVVTYKAGQILHDFVHGVGSIKNKLIGGANDSTKGTQKKKKN